MKRLILVAILLGIGVGGVYGIETYLHAYGTFIPVSAHVPITIFGNNQTTAGFAAGAEIEFVLPIESILGITMFAGAKYVFDREIIGLAYSLAPIYGGAKISLRIPDGYPWSLYALTRVGYSFFIPTEDYFIAVMGFCNLRATGGFYFNAGLGSEVLIGGPVSLITEANFDLTMVDVEQSPAIIEDYRFEVLLGLSIHLQ